MGCIGKCHCDINRHDLWPRVGKQGQSSLVESSCRMRDEWNHTKSGFRDYLSGLWQISSKVHSSLELTIKDALSIKKLKNRPVNTRNEASRLMNRCSHHLTFTTVEYIRSRRNRISVGCGEDFESPLLSLIRMFDVVGKWNMETKDAEFVSDVYPQRSLDCRMDHPGVTSPV